nr:hypothetical protein BaRGS_017814 [Batillaria attramentaria]
MNSSLFSLAVPLSLLCGILAALYFLKNVFTKSRKLPPGPRGLPALRAVLKAIKTGTLHEQAKLWCAQYGELVLCRTLIGDICFLNSANQIIIIIIIIIIIVVVVVIIIIIIIIIVVVVVVVV